MKKTSFIPVAILAAALQSPAAQNHRLFVLTDISSLQPGVLEPDDGQSLIRLMLYTNDIDLEGFGASSNLGHGQRTRPDLILRVIEAYEKRKATRRLG